MNSEQKAVFSKLAQVMKQAAVGISEDEWISITDAIEYRGQGTGTGLVLSLKSGRVEGGVGIATFEAKDSNGAEASTWDVKITKNSDINLFQRQSDEVLSSVSIETISSEGPLAVTHGSMSGEAWVEAIAQANEG